MFKRKDVSELLGINNETIRFYENKGLLPHFNREENGYRIFNKEHIIRLTFILQAKDFGFTLTEIKELIDSGIADYITREKGQELDKTVKTELLEKLDNKIGNLDKEIERLTSMRNGLKEYRDEKKYLNLKEYNFCKIKQRLTMYHNT